MSRQSPCSLDFQGQPEAGDFELASAYAQAPANYERGYVRHRHAYRFGTSRAIDRDKHLSTRPKRGQGRYDVQVAVIGRSPTGKSRRFTPKSGHVQRN
jgi:hypothetical protein